MVAQDLRDAKTEDLETLLWGAAPVLVTRYTGLIDYASAQKGMEDAAAQIAAGESAGMIWLLEHPPLLTAGTSAQSSDLIDPQRFPVYQTRRGGQFTYHGPGQRIVYLMLNLRQHNMGARAYVEALQNWLIAALGLLGVDAFCRAGRTGVWTRGTDRAESKIAAIGVQIRHGVSLHGAAINVAPDLSHFNAIVPCGLPQFGVTSLAARGLGWTLPDVDQALLQSIRSGLLFRRVERRKTAQSTSAN